MKLTRPIAALAALALVAGACGGDNDDSNGSGSGNGDGGTPTGANGTPVWDIDVALDADPDCADPLTGDGLILGYAADFSELGGFADVPAAQAAEIFIRQINCSGGIDGTPVSLVVRDISGDPETTQRAVEELLSDGVVGILGPPFPDFGSPLLQVTQGNVPVIFTGSTEPMLADTDANSFLVSMDDTRQARAAAEFALDQGWTTAVTFSFPGAYFGYNPQVFTEAFTAGGGTIINDYNFVPADDIDFSTQVNSIANGEAPDVVYGAMLSFQIAALLSQLEGAGVTTNFIGTDAVEATGGYFTPGLDGVFHTTHAFGPGNERYQKLAAVIEATAGAESESPTFAALAVDGIAVLINAYERTGSLDPAVLGAAIPGTTGVQGITSVLTFSGNASPDKTVYVHQIVDGAPTLAAEIN